MLLGAGWVGLRTYQAYRHLDRAAQQVTLLQQQVKTLDEIDLTQAGAAVSRMRSEADGAVGDTRDPLYRLAGHLPFIGPNLRAVAMIASTVDDLATTTAPTLINVATAVQPAALAPRSGVIDLAPMVAAAPALAAADAAVASSQQRMAAIDRGPLVGPVSRGVDDLQTKLAGLGRTTAAAVRISRLAPTMLGHNGARTYLVVFQNLAEPRATGGLFGSYALLKVDDGKLSIGPQGSGSRDLGTFAPPLTMPASLPSALYGNLPATYATDANLTPDFPTAAALLAQMYQIRNHLRIDGVLALDPVALSYLLVGAEPIPIGHGLELTSANITRTLLSTAYALYPRASDGPRREAFLDSAAERAFLAVTNIRTSAKTVLRGLVKASDQHRLLLWSANRTEQTDIEATGVAGRLPSVDGHTPTIGLFRNDGTGGKLGYYAGGSAALTSGACTADARRALTLTAHLTYSAPATGLPAYVIGYATAGPYVLRTNLLIFGPLTGSLTAISVDGQHRPVIWATEGGRRVGMVTIDLKPGASATVVATLSIAAPASGSPALLPALNLTPGVTSWKTTAEPIDPC
ncbi:DUF4012 domain-containing protein [Nakamurella sp. PAMC28650]|uniref:DUF4012 domain-containing protein n=1 Tax=Nakamurella sp. PAMC28650 TaxID=2762325 RepID=UPI00164E7FDF|nr:DUF4012 domain-containing protein [Nakamurella sp. PAMC28650]QNK80983.1 DUF4012 domain-containing protein [Nakamurella sp. PAMC28650]